MIFKICLKFLSSLLLLLLDQFPRGLAGFLPASLSHQFYMLILVGKIKVSENLGLWA